VIVMVGLALRSFARFKLPKWKKAVNALFGLHVSSSRFSLSFLAFSLSSSLIYFLVFSFFHFLLFLIRLCGFLRFYRLLRFLSIFGFFANKDGVKSTDMVFKKKKMIRRKK
jgi:hypothetical protein